MIQNKRGAMIKCYILAAALGLTASVSAGPANAEILQLQCTWYYGNAPDVPLLSVFLIDLDHSLIVAGLPLDGRRVYAGPLPVTITAQNFVFNNNREIITIDRLTGDGSDGFSQIKGCTKQDGPYPADAPSLTQKF